MFFQVPNFFFSDNEKKLVFIVVFECHESEYGIYFLRGPFLLHIFGTFCSKKAKIRRKRCSKYIHHLFKLGIKVSVLLKRQNQRIPSHQRIYKYGCADKYSSFIVFSRCMYITIIDREGRDKWPFSNDRRAYPHSSNITSHRYVHVGRKKEPKKSPECTAWSYFKIDYVMAENF